MDPLQYSNSNSPADDGAPRTPSPPMPARYPSGSPQHNYKAELDPVRIFSQDESTEPAPYAHWAPPSATHFARPSLLQELYESEEPEHQSPPDMYVDQDWPAPSPPQQQRPADYTLIRRATFPYARQERPEDMAAYPPFLSNDHHGAIYASDLPLSAEPAALHGADGTYSPPGYEYDNGVKLEDADHHLHYHQQPPPQFYRPSHPTYPYPSPHHPHSHHAHYAPHGAHLGFPPHGLPVQHTDDAASKETQYLRRRCFNCHTTEPPSWRRSTLNPGKIVCNKCGLYERTHLRARPLRFDELRAGGKARKGGKSPKGVAKKASMGGMAPQGGSGARRSSVSSTGSSVQSGSGASDWDDSVSVYSNGSAPPTSFNSPAFSPHAPALALSSHSSAHSHTSGSRSPPLLGSPPHSAGLSSNGQGIRLPHAPDIPTLGHRTKPRSNTTGGLPHHPHAQPYYAHQGALHHSSSNSSLHSLHSHHGSPHPPPGQSPHLAPLHMGSPHLAPMQMHAHEELYRRPSMPELGHGGWGDEAHGMMMVKEEPRAVVV
ncbi:hypothetical protein DFH07DRAFT_1057793 [Mycena maculata]|uniref:GATA-type domain-containing protein n=1 Tax=Mycena maculata TaxID=230809 RepID=A0AAD7JT06_9AGAR|nr:hypothetical protein DFH07DRAFT_1057793 [Mycena maculata]